MLSRCAALGLIAGGFALTGDLGWVTARGMRVINSRTIPVAETPAETVTAAATAPVTPGPALIPPRHPGVAAELSSQAPPPPRSGSDEVRIAALRAGDRILVWLQAARGDLPGMCLALDVIDPASGEALLAEVASLSPDGSLRAAGPPRRVVVGAGGTGPGAPAIRRGTPLFLRPEGLARAPAETPGTVAALVVVAGGG